MNTAKDRSGPSRFLDTTLPTIIPKTYDAAALRLAEPGCSPDKLDPIDVDADVLTSAAERIMLGDSRSGSERSAWDSETAQAEGATGSGRTSQFP